jgi:hypothetical protein
VFLNKDHTQVALASARALCRSETDREVKWSCEALDARRDAIVRHVWNGRPCLEPRLGGPDPN